MPSGKVLPIESHILDGFGGLDPLHVFWSRLRAGVVAFSPARTSDARAENRDRLTAILRETAYEPAEMVKCILPHRDYPALWKDEYGVGMNPIEVCSDVIDYPPSRIRLLEVCDAVLARLRASRPKVEGAEGEATASATKGEADGVKTDAAVSPPALNTASPQAIATGLLMQGKNLTEIADHLGVRRQDFYEKPEWALFLPLALERSRARKARRRRRRAGQNPDTQGSSDDS